MYPLVPRGRMRLHRRHITSQAPTVPQGRVCGLGGPMADDNEDRFRRHEAIMKGLARLIRTADNGREAERMR